MCVCVCVRVCVMSPTFNMCEHTGQITRPKYLSPEWGGSHAGVKPATSEEASGPALPASGLTGSLETGLRIGL